MKHTRDSLTWGILLVVVGVLLLLGRSNWLIELNLSAWLGSLAMLVGGGAFVSVYLVRRGHWWPTIVGAALIGVGIMLALTELGMPGRYAVGGLLLSLAVAFANVFRLHRNRNWWALIPGGMLVLTTIITCASKALDGAAIVAVLFLGLSAVFWALYLFARGLAWARVSALSLLALGVVVYVVAADEWWLVRYWPLLLVGLGAFLLFRAIRTRRAGQ